MTDLSEKLKHLSPEKRRLLEMKLQEKAQQVNTFPVSFAQQRLWFLDQLEPGSPYYNIPSGFRLKGPFQVAPFRKAIGSIIERHEILRTTFIAINGKPMQRVHQTITCEIPLIDITAHEHGEDHILQLAKEEARQPFALDRGPLFRVKIIKAGEDDHVVLLTMHHIISDGWSMGVMISELTRLYSAFVEDQPSQLPALPIQYADFAVWQRKYLQGAVLEKQLNYWKKQLAGSPAVLEFPVDKARPAVQTNNGSSRQTHFSKEIKEGIDRLSRKLDATNFMTLLSAFYVLLSKYTRQQDICVGTPIAGRTRAELEGLIGAFINTLVLRARFEDNPTFARLVSRVRAITLEAYEHQDIPFEYLVEALHPDRQMSHSPLFQVMFILQNTPTENIPIADLQMTRLNVDMGTATFDLSFSLTELPDGISISVEYNTDLFLAGTIELLLQRFSILLESVIDNPDLKISEYSLLTAGERTRIFEEWNRTGTRWPDELPVQHYFQRQAAAAPDHTALIELAEDNTIARQLTYGDLNRQANRLARYLIDKGAKPELPVAIMLPRSVDSIISLLAVLKAGAAYLAIDPGYPPERIRDMLSDSACRYVISDSSSFTPLSEEFRDIMHIDLESIDTSACDSSDPCPGVTSENLAYLIYTSGSTGQPKAVQVEHGNLTNYTLHACRQFELTASDRVLQFASLSFDAAAEEIFPCLSSGATLVLRNDRMISSMPEFIRTVADYHISVIDLPTAFWHHLTDALSAQSTSLPKALRLIIIGGERALPDKMRFWADTLRPGLRLLNTYGPTETTIVSTVWELPQNPAERSFSGEVPIGRPVSNTRAYVLDENLNPVPPGIPGELCISGKCVARGYLNRPELTAERFLKNPFDESDTGRLYRTGDLVRYLPDGNLEYLGRIDQQVKIRGFRVELGEIEARLNAHKQVKMSAVTTFQAGPADIRLVAFVVSRDNQDIAAAELRDWLLDRLPGFMVPAAFIKTDHLPLTAGGKINRKALPRIDQNLLHGQTAVEYEAPSGLSEELVAGLFAELLQFEEVGAAHNFFEMGGHSLLATQLVSKIKDQTGVELPLRAIFENPSVRELARLIDREKSRAGEIQGPEITPVPRGDHLVLSFAQQRLWFLDQLEPNTPHYNIPDTYRLTGRLNLTALQQSLDFMIERHESLRTCFESVDGQPVQRIARDIEYKIALTDLSELDEAGREQGLQSLAEQAALQPFDLSRAPLFRMELIRLSELEHAVILVMHHIIADGWSLQIFMSEMARAYNAFDTGLQPLLPPLKIQYADYAAWQRNWLKGEVLQRQLDFWKKELAACSTTLDLPIAKGRPEIQSYHGNHLPFTIDARTSQQLRQLSRNEGATLFMTLLSAFATLLFRYSGQDDMNIGTPIANRNRSSIEGLIGFFVNTLVMRVRLDGQPTFRALLRDVRQRAFEVFAHQDLPFEKVVDAIQHKRDLSHSPLFQVMFLMQNISSGQPGPADGGLRIESLPLENRISQFDLTLVMAEAGQKLSGGFEYNTDIFDDSAIQRLSAHFQIILRQLAADPDIPLSRIELISPAEKELILHKWSRNIVPRSHTPLTHSLVDQQCQSTPQAIALISGDRQFTYAELFEKSNRLARFLRQKGVGPEIRVGLCLERSAEMIIALLSILKAGGAYVPLDPNYPEDRLNFMVRDAGVGLIITADKLKKIFDSAPADLVALDSLRDQISSFSAETIDWPQPGPDNLAYIIYTSGSTGQPKGVSVSHRSLVNHNLAVSRYFDITPADKILQFATINFDAAGEEIYPALQNGATLVLRGTEVLLSGMQLTGLIRRHGLTILDLPTTYWQQIVSELADAGQKVPPTLRLVILGGDRATAEHFHKWNQMGGQNIRLINSYGPTETTIVSTVYEATESERKSGRPVELPIGRPIDNTEVYVLDKQMEPVPVGLPGELYIGGDGLARGYQNRPDLTAEAFVPNPFSEQSGSRLYRTGDLVCYSESGQIRFIGRVDDQAKIRGFRVETAEIESVLNKHPKIGQAAVLARETAPGIKRLVAYCVPGHSPALKPDDRRRHPRVALDDQVTVQTAAGQQTVHRLRDISLGGISMAVSESLLEKAQQIELALILPESGQELRLQASVAWTCAGRAGVAFTDMDEHSRDLLQRAIDNAVASQRILIGELRGFLTARLPEYMIPSAFVLLDELPKLPNGKLDRRALPEAGDVRPELSAKYVAPGTDREIILAEIIKEILGVQKVGIHDNFFELGGDSILSIQVIAKARQKGLHLTPVQMFKYQTIAELAPVASSAPIIEAEQGLVTGPVPLTPIQHWFVAQNFPQPDHFNQSLMLAIDQPLDPDKLRAVCAALLTQHDILRLSLRNDDGRWIQAIETLPEEPPFTVVDLSSADPQKRTALIEEQCDHFQRSLSLCKGPVWRMIYFDLGPESGSRLLIIAHHMAIDAFSWRVLLEDFQLAYQQLENGQEVDLPPKTTSFRHWAEKLLELASSQKTADEQNYWLTMSRTVRHPLPVDFTTGSNKEGSTQSEVRKLNNDLTEALLKEVPAVYKTEINDILLTALVRGVSRWTGKRRLLVHLEGHGREDLFADADVSRTVGWFTSLYPVLLDLGTTVECGQAIKQIKEQLHQVPNRGLGFGLLRYLHPDAAVREQLATLDQTDITFNYLGQMDQEMTKQMLFRPAPENKGRERGTDNPLGSLLDITAVIAGGRLNLSVDYSTNLFRAETIKFVADAVLDELEQIIRHCQNPGSGAVTASDFKLAGLDNKKLDKVLTQLGKKKRKK